MLNQTATLTGITAAHKESERVEKKLIETALNEDAEMFDRIDACRQLCSKGGKASIKALASLLNGDERLAHMARYGLQTNPSSEVEEVLREALDDAEGRNLMGIMWSLGEREDTKAVDAIAKHLTSSDSHVAACAARALGRIANDEAFDALRNVIREGSVDRGPLYEGILRCANAFEKTNKEMAGRIYSRLQEGNAPDHVKHGAKLGAERLG